MTLLGGFCFAFCFGFRDLGFDDLGIGGNGGVGEVDHAAIGEFLEHDVFDLDGHGGATVDLEGEEAFERALSLFEVEEVDGDLAVDFVDEVIALGDDGVLMPVGDIDFDGVVFGGKPTFGFGVDDNALAILADDAAAAFFVDHGVVDGSGVDITLVTADGPFADFREFPAAILDAGVVTDDFDFGGEFEVFDGAAAPDEELVVVELSGVGGFAGDATVLDGPKFGVPIPAGEVLAVEQGFEAILSGEEAGSDEREEETANHVSPASRNGPDHQSSRQRVCRIWQKRAEGFGFVQSEWMLRAGRERG